MVWRIISVGVLFVLASSLMAADQAPDYQQAVAPILQKYCAGCHNADEREGEFSVETFDELQKGGEHGAAVLAGDAGSSRLIRLVTGAAEPKMPPEDKPQPTADEVAILKAWVAAGAKGPRGQEPDRTHLKVPTITPKAGLADPVTALDWSADGQLIAEARFGRVAILSADTLKPTTTLEGVAGKVTALHFASGNRLVTASGIPGLYGQAILWDLATGKPIREIRAHRDVLYDAELSPNGELMATCSYDRKIMLWSVATGELVRSFDGHTGAVYDIAFSPDGTTLLSGSADDTCKVWQVATGERLDTLGQPLKEVYSVSFNPAGDLLTSVGADNRIRVWKLLSKDSPVINPQLIARFAHEAPVTQMRYSSDGRYLVTAAEDLTVKLWDAKSVMEIKEFGRQPDVVQALAFAPDGGHFVVGRVDGSVEKLATVPPSMPVAPARAAVAPVSAPSEASPMQEVTEAEPNNSPTDAMPITLPAKIKGVIQGRPDDQPDRDVYKFSAKAGEAWVVEVDAAQSKSPLDSIVEVVDLEGHPIERVLLQAVRDSYFTFRGKNGNEVGDFRVFNWEEMELNEYLYSNGEVVKLWLAPRGPDSGYIVYPGEGSRYGYFDTTPVSHALSEACYIVEPYAPGSEITPNGLPVFKLYYQNDDESHRERGADSKLTFTAPKDGEYLVRIRDVRGFESDKHTYQLTVRPQKPDFQVTLQNRDLTVNAGSAKEFKVTAKRMDDYDGPIRVDITGLPPGFTSTSPITIQAGQNSAFGMIMAAADAPAPTPENTKSKLTASAVINGQDVTHEVGVFGEIKRGDAPKLTIKIVAAEDGAKVTDPGDGSPLQVEIEPEQTIMLKVVAQRNGYEGNVPFGNETSGRNLPHGLIVGNIGLNGLLILEKQTERNFFISATSWVPEQERLFHLKTDVEGGQATAPVLIRVRRSQKPGVAQQ